MFTPDQYELIDFGDGRRLERFGPWLLDRPCPAVERTARANPDAWAQADARFERGDGDEGQWIYRRQLPERWTVAYGPITFELKPTAVGHLGLFPEQAANWQWLEERGRESFLPTTTDQRLPTPFSVLNLFAYTGGSTLAAAAADGEVVHVDSARNTVGWARRNAEQSGMADLPIRWIAEDAMKFARRELKRGNRYDAVILDPPSYGHGLKGELWQLSQHLPELLDVCAQLTAGRRRFMLLTCHTPGYDSSRLKGMMEEAMGQTDNGRTTAGPLTLQTAAGRKMPSGVCVRWVARP